jgi:HK97 family phage major capsid protein
MKKWLLEMIRKKEEARTALKAKGKASENVEEVRSIQAQIEAIDAEMLDFRQRIDTIPDEPAAPAAAGEQTPQGDPEQRGGAPVGETRVLASYGIGQGQCEPVSPGMKTAEEREAAEKRGKDLKENRSVTVASTGVILPKHQATDIRPAFNEVSSLIDRVSTKALIGGESYEQSYVSSYGTGDYKAEEADYATAEPIFGYAAINKSKVTAYAEDTEELQKLPAADYDAEVMKGVTIASRKKITREILIGTGATNHLAGIFSAAATAIAAGTDLPIAEIDETTLDEIVYSFGGDEDVEDAAVLILNKKDLKEFASLRSADGKRVYTVVNNGNSGTIDSVPFIINSACEAISDPTTVVGEYCMAYGPLSNYLLTIFSDTDVQRSTDYKFKQGMIAHRASTFVGGNVVSKNGFLRVVKQ